MGDRFMVGRVPAGSVVLAQSDGTPIATMTPDEAEQVAVLLVAEAREIREHSL